MSACWARRGRGRNWSWIIWTRPPSPRTPRASGRLWARTRPVCDRPSSTAWNWCRTSNGVRNFSTNSASAGDMTWPPISPSSCSPVGCRRGTNIIRHPISTHRAATWRNGCAPIIAAPCPTWCSPGSSNRSWRGTTPKGWRQSFRRMAARSTSSAAMASPTFQKRRICPMAAIPCSCALPVPPLIFTGGPSYRRKVSRGKTGPMTWRPAKCAAAPTPSCRAASTASSCTAWITVSMPTTGPAGTPSSPAPSPWGSAGRSMKPIRSGPAWRRWPPISAVSSPYCRRVRRWCPSPISTVVTAIMSA